MPCGGEGRGSVNPVPSAASRLDHCRAMVGMIARNGRALRDGSGVDPAQSAGVPAPPRSLPLLVGAVLPATLVWCWTLDSAPGDDTPSATAALAPRDASGRRLYLLIIDSLALSDLDHLPALRALGDGNFAATVQPCTDNFTTSCVKEALTGWSRESLFSACCWRRCC